MASIKQITSTADFIAAVENHLKTNGISRYKLSKLAKVNEGNLGRILSGLQEPKLITALKIAKALDFKVTLKTSENE